MNHLGDENETVGDGCLILKPPSQEYRLGAVGSGFWRTEMDVVENFTAWNFCFEIRHIKLAPNCLCLAVEVSRDMLDLAQLNTKSIEEFSLRQNHCDGERISTV